MIIATLEIKRHTHCYTWSEALCSMPYMMGSFMLIALQGVKLYAHCYTCSEALSSFLYMV